MQANRSIQIKDLSLSDLLYICKRLRQSDRDEIFCTKDDESPENLACSIFSARDSGVAWVACAGPASVPVCAFGAYRQYGDVWSLWLIATDDWKKVARTVTKFGLRFVIPYLVQKMGMSLGHCLSHSENLTAHKWLHCLGGYPEAVLTNWGKNGEDFVRFIWVCK